MAGKIVSATKQSKIVRYKLEELCVNLKRSGLSYSQIADELNNSGKVPENDRIDKYVISRFLEKLPEVTKEIVSNDKKRMLEVVNSNINIIHETGLLYNRTKQLLENLEERSASNNGLMNPYMYKALCSEMRELLRQMTEVQKEVNDYSNVRRFLEIVIEVLQEECPENLPVIVQKLRLTKGTSWFADIINKG